MRYEQYKIMQDIREIEFRDSGSNTNTKTCFEVWATALCPRLHTEGFPPRPHRTSHQGNLIAIIKLEYTTPLSNTTTSTQEANPKINHLYTSGTRHKAKPQSPLHKRDRHEAKTKERLRLGDHNRPRTTLGDHSRPKIIFLTKTRSYTYDKYDSSSVRK